MQHTEIGKYANIEKEHPQYVITVPVFLRHIKKANFEYYWAASLILVERERARSGVRLRPAVRRVKVTKMFVH